MHPRSIPFHPRHSRRDAIACALHRLGPAANILLCAFFWASAMFLATNALLDRHGFHPHGEARTLWLVATLVLWCGSGVAIGMAHWLRVEHHVSRRRMLRGNQE